MNRRNSSVPRARGHTCAYWSLNTRDKHVGDRMFGFKLAVLETKILECEAGGGKEAA